MSMLPFKIQLYAKDIAKKKEQNGDKKEMLQIVNPVEI